jgi:MFS family permease
VIASGGFRVLAPLRQPTFRRAWLAAVVDGFGTGVERLAVGWFVLDTTGSVFLAALSFAARSAPNMLFGPIGGAIADRFRRPRVMVATTTTKALLFLGAAGLVAAGVDSAWPLLALVAMTGVARTSETPATQAMIADIVGAPNAPRAISVHSLGVRSVAMVGAFAGGLLVERAGTETAFLAAASASAAAAVVYSSLRIPRTTIASRERTSVWADALDGLRVVLRIPVVLMLLLLAVGIEVFAFSFNSLMPGLAERVLHLDASGLGALTFASGLGGVAGSAALSLFVDSVRRGPLLIGVTAAFGLALASLSASDRFVLSLPLVAVIGAMAAMFDALQWTLLQASVPDAVRGRVIGTWMTAIGFGWLGPVILGTIAESFDVRVAVATGGLVAGLLACVALSSTQLRRL